MQVHKKPFQKRFQCIVHLFRRRNGLKNVNTYWLIWEEKNSWIDDKRKRMWKFLTLQTNPLGTIPLFCRKTEIGGHGQGENLQKCISIYKKHDDLAFSENHLAVANVLKCSQLLVFTSDESEPSWLEP